jgi:hypothetical protein
MVLFITGKRAYAWCFHCPLTVQYSRFYLASANWLLGASGYRKAKQRTERDHSSLARITHLGYRCCPWR